MSDKKLTIERSMADFKRAYRSKRTLVERQKEDFLFRLGRQWDAEKERKLKDAGINPVVDNRIQPNIFLLTGLERQNRADFKAFPEGEEDSVKAEVASALFKDSIKKSDFGYKKSEAFEDGVTCGESNLELYLDNTYNLLNGKPCWKKIDGNMVFPAPGCKEYDYSDAPYLYKLTKGLSKDDLISLFPEKAKKIEKAEGGKLDFNALMGNGEVHNQPKDYPKDGGNSESEEDEEGFDLLERYYKKWVKKSFIGDRQTGSIQEAETPEKAEEFVVGYKGDVQAEQEQMIQAAQMQQMQAQEAMAMGIDPALIPQPAPQPEQRDPERFFVFTRPIPEIWYFAHVSGIKEPLADEVAWFYPKWKLYPIIPYFARFSTAPIEGDDRHLLIQGVVHGVKGLQQKHNSAETLKLLHLNTAQNSGWLSEEDSWVDPEKVKQFGSVPGTNLEYKKGRQKPERQLPMPLSQAHTQIAQESADAIIANLGIDVSLFAIEESSNESGKALALRERQRIIMIQQLFDNLSRTSQICGKFLLSQMGEMYDTETAKKVLGEAYLTKTFPAPTLLNEMTGQPEPMQDPKTGQPMQYDVEMADLVIAEVLSGELGLYDVTVGEAVASETMKLAKSLELQDLATKFPGIVPPDMIVQESQISEGTKNKILSAIRQAQAMAATQPGNLPPNAVAA